jgi:hypothetical protein
MATIEITEDDLERVKAADAICESECIGPELDELIEKMEKALKAESLSK